jgi:drug/metabolite transporter (DMT)-like permease
MISAPGREKATEACIAMAHLWILLSLCSAFALATSDALTKRVITSENEYVIAWFRILFALPILTAAVLISGPLPHLDRTFILASCAALPLEITAILLYYKALRLSPLSLSLPFLSLTPVFLILFSLIIVGEPVSAAGAAGIGLIALGGYTLNLSALRTGFLAPFTAVVKERGSLFMLLVALIFSVTSALGKLAIDHSSPAFFGAAYFAALVVFLLPVLVRRTGVRGLGASLRTNARDAALPALFDAIATVTHFYAVSMANVAYMISVKRTSLLIGSLYGFLLFGERNMRERLTGAVLMFSGFATIVLLG